MKKIYLIFFALLCMPALAFPAVLMQDNFDSWNTFNCTTHSCADPEIRSPWDSWGLTDGDGLQVGMDAAFGRSGKGYRIVYNGGFKGAGLNSVSFSSSSEIYIRFSMKFGSDANWSPPMSNGMKLFRVNFPQGEYFRLEFGPSNDGLYLIIDSSSSVYPRDYGGTTYTWGMYNNGSDDTASGGNNWRTVEVHAKYVSNGNDVADIWVDGANILHATNLTFPGSSFTDISLGDNAEYLAGSLYFDDFIVATTYNGPVGDSPATPTNPINGSIANGSFR